MSQVRCETDLDASTGKYFLEIFFPVDSDVALVRSPARYASHDDARAAAIEMFRRAGAEPEPAFPKPAPLNLDTPSVPPQTLAPRSEAPQSLPPLLSPASAAPSSLPPASLPLSSLSALSEPGFSNAPPSVIVRAMAKDARAQAA
jgi:hypothetical protein